MTATLQTPGLSKNDGSIKEDTVELQIIGTDLSFKHEIVWPNAIGFLILHIISLWALCLIFTGEFSLKTVIWLLAYAYTCGEGITIGAHRLYTHRSFKSTPLLRAILLILQAAAGQNSMFTWCRDHRLHHRFSDTDADPHNAKRGFFFSHIGWLMYKKHPYVIELGKKIDMSDLKADWMVMLQKKYYLPLFLVTAVVFPVWVPVHFFGEPLWKSVIGNILRYAYQLNVTWLVNSAAHLYGTRPYDKNIQPVESWFVSMMSLGEGWHNYHHAFPWDYKAAELSAHFNYSAQIIEWCEKIGLAYDLKTASSEMVKNRTKRTGDDTHNELGNDESKAAVTATGPLHPLNPTYTVTYKDPEAVLKISGLPLYHENDTFDCSKVTFEKKIRTK